MSIPTASELKQFAKNYVALWNAGDKEAWVQNWRAVGPGDFTMFDPVGTPPKHGFEACALEPWELFNARVHFNIKGYDLGVKSNPHIMITMFTI